MRYFFGLILIFMLAAAPTIAEDAFVFERQVRPILIEHCHQCHGPESQKSDLRLDSRDAALRGGSRGPAIKPGAPEDSLLIQAVEYHGEFPMPPEGRLDASEIAVLRHWIARGAAWPGGETGSLSAAGERIDIEAGRTHWAFQPLQRPTVPGVKDSGWTRTPIDNFILRQLEARSLAPAPRADKRTLIRRLYFDLLGLPPAPQEVDAFLKDSDPGAYGQLVESLLASPHYGERWARHWLDIVRYTDSFDSRGSAATDPIEIWRYRDWVVRSFNQDLPYDDFLRYQIAGDLIPAPENQFNADGLVATGVLAIGHWPQGDADKEKMVTDIVDDQIDLVTRGFMGITLACARCHDHKFDPFTMQDYYGLAGIFFSSSILPGPGAKTEGSPILHLPLAPREEVEARQKRTLRLAELEAEQSVLIEAERLAWIRVEAARTAAYIEAALLNEGEEALNPEALERWRALLGVGSLPPLARLQQEVHGLPGLHARLGRNNMPSATLNTTGNEAVYATITHPARSLVVHPAPDAPARVAWRADSTGTYQIEALLADADDQCGDGVRWTLALFGPGRSEVLGEGTLANGAGAEANPVMGAFNAGDFIILSVLPNAEYSCDSTVVEMRVTAEGGTSHSLTASLLEAFVIENPAPDAAGRAAAWWLLDDSPALVADPDLLAPIFSAHAAYTAGGVADALRSAARGVQDALTGAIAQPEHFPAAAALLGEHGPFWIASPPPTAGSRRAELEVELAQLRHEAAVAPPLDLAVGIQEGGVPGTAHEGIHDVAIHRRGAYNNLGDITPRRMPLVLAADESAATPRLSGSGRRELADFIASARNPLTARVMVNRIWQAHFGEGLVRTPGDFGRQGEAPSHPELLDWLAAEFIESGWSVKHLHRLILSSATWQQSTAAPASAIASDPENRLFARMNRRRLEAETLRDSLLAVAGKLELSPGGPAYQDMNTPRRTLYLRTVRSDRSTYPILFDAADPTSIIPKRTEATVAPQALFMMNDPFVIAQAEALAQRVAPLSEAAAVTELHRLLFGRDASGEDQALAAAFQGGETGLPPAQRLAAYAQVLLASNEFIFIE